MSEITLIALFSLGLIVGSFLNVLITFLEGKRKNLIDRSFCDNCRQTLKWYELVPLLSFIIQLGRCRGCKKRISFQYPLLELAMALLFVFWAETWFDFLFLSGLLVIFVYDLRHMLVPEIIVIPALILSGILNLSNWPAAAIAAGFFALLVFLSHESWLGWGDVEIAALMGFLLGFPTILLALLLAFVIGALYGIILICLKLKTLKSALPFGPFLVASTVFFLNDPLSHWLSSLWF